jgi:hypothetical protein
MHSEVGAYGDARERARKHVSGKGKVWREGFIAGATVSGLVRVVIVV